MKSAGIKGGHRLCLAVALALGVASQAQAIGLGAIEVKSQLGKPFVAEIPITLSTPDEAKNLSVRLASPEAFARVGLERPNDLSANLQFSVGKNARGEPVVRISTPQAMTDPYVSFLLEADWGRGKMVREYTALLDPPHMTAIRRMPITAPVVRSTPMPAPATPSIAPPTVPTPVATAPANASEPSAPAPDVAAPPEPAAPEPLATAPMEIPQPSPVPPPPAETGEPQPESPAPLAGPEPTPIAAAPENIPSPSPQPEIAVAPAPEAAPQANPGTHTVARGETLSQIAGGAHGEVSLNRMMIALQRANPDAFIHQNINLLKSGSVLRIPASEEAQTLSADEANLLVQQQVESWRQSASPSLQPSTEISEIPRPAEKTEQAKPEVASAAVENKPEPAKPRARKSNSAIARAAAAKSAADATATPGTAETPPAKPAVARVSRAHLEIVPPAGAAARGSQTGASAGGSGNELRAELAQTKEDLAARNSEVGELKSRVADLEKMQTDNQSLLTMKDSKLAAMEQRLAELEKNNAATALPASPASSASSTVATVMPPAPATNASTSSPAAAAVTANAASTPTPTPTATVASPVQPEVETPWYERPLVQIGAGLLVLAGLLGLLLRGRHRPTETVRPSRYDSSALAASIPSPRAPADAIGTASTGTAAPVRDEPVPPPITAPAAPPAAVVRRPYWTGAYDADQKVVDHAPQVATEQPTVVRAAAVTAPKPVEPVAPGEHDDWALDTPAVAASTATKQPAAPVAPQDVDQAVATKMELARAYIDIGDAEGARGMLEEVLMEGSDSQREDALKLLETLD